MPSPRLNHVCFVALTVLSLTAFFTVLTGFFQAAQADEGTGAHIFQLSIVALGHSFTRRRPRRGAPPSRPTS